MQVKYQSKWSLVTAGTKVIKLIIPALLKNFPPLIKLFQTSSLLPTKC